MAITGLHTNWKYGSYEKDRNEEIKRSENDDLRGGDLSWLKYYDEKAASIAIGYGFDLLAGSNAEINAYFTDASVGLGALSTTDAALLDQARERRSAGTAAEAYLQGIVGQLTLSLGTEAKAEALLNKYILDRAEPDLNLFLAKWSIGVLPSSQERAALVSLAYNNAGELLGDALGRALQAGDRAEAFYEIAYHSNGGSSRSQGIANRRYREADLFGLYNEGMLTDADAKAAFRMYTRHQDKILGPDGVLGGTDGYEDKYPPPEVGMGILAQLAPARAFLIDTYVTQPGIAITITGDILVGENDGSGGGADTRYLTGTDRDDLTGGAGNDLVLGESGDDRLEGGGGQDILYGGAGFDTYVVDAQDVIDDAGGSGRVYLGNRQLTGGSRTATDPPNTYHGGGDTYVLDGTTLTINGGLTVRNYDKTQGSLQIFLTPPGDETAERPETGPAEIITSPLVLDLDGDGIETLAVGAYYFDLDADGLSERSGWVSPDDGLLVHDRNGDGRISNGTELLGNHSVLRNGDTAQNGFQALAEYDDNGDGAVDAQDAAYGALQVWRDLNGNGRSDAGELQALADAGVVSISTGYSVSGEVDAYGHEHRQVSAPTQRSSASRIARRTTKPPARWTRANKFEAATKEAATKISKLPVYKPHVKVCTA